MSQDIAQVEIPQEIWRILGEGLTRACTARELFTVARFVAQYHGWPTDDIDRQMAQFTDEELDEQDEAEPTGEGRRQALPADLGTRGSSDVEGWGCLKGDPGSS